MKEEKAIRHNEQFVIYSNIYFFMLLVFIILGSINHNKVEIINNENTSDEIINNNQININVVKHDEKYLAFGEKDNTPYLAILNETQDKIISEFSFNGDGRIKNIDDNQVFSTLEIEANDETTTKTYLITYDKLIPYFKKQLTINYTKNRTINPKYIVIHETANTRAGADANAHYRYWSTNLSANASTHFVVDSNEIYQMLELNQMAWHVGDNKGHSNITNTNSIGIEICVNSDGDYMKTWQNTVYLTMAIMNELNMSIDQLKTHIDSSGKADPKIMFENNLWDDFVYQVSLGLNN